MLLSATSAGGVFAAALGEVVPDEHHGDAARDADEDEAHHVVGVVAQEEHREQEHQHRADEPVLREGEAEDAGVGEDLGELRILHLRQRRIHHENEADGDGQVGRANGERGKQRLGVGDHELAEEDPDSHGGEDPDREIPVEEGHVLGDGFSHRIGLRGTVRCRERFNARRWTFMPSLKTATDRGARRSPGTRGAAGAPWG